MSKKQWHKCWEVVFQRIGLHGVLAFRRLLSFFTRTPTPNIKGFQVHKSTCRPHGQVLGPADLFRFFPVNLLKKTCVFRFDPMHCAQLHRWKLVWRAPTSLQFFFLRLSMKVYIKQQPPSSYSMSANPASQNIGQKTNAPKGTFVNWNG